MHLKFNDVKGKIFNINRFPINLKLFNQTDIDIRYYVPKKSIQIVHNITRKWLD